MGPLRGKLSPLMGNCRGKVFNWWGSRQVLTGAKVQKFVLSCIMLHHLLVSTSGACHGKFKLRQYPFKLQENGIEAFIGIEYKTNEIGYTIKRRIVQCDDKRFSKVALTAFDKMKHTRIGIGEKTDTIYLQYKINGSTTSINPQADVLIIGYSDSNVRVLTN